jgi:hypothetical protein
VTCDNARVTRGGGTRHYTWYIVRETDEFFSYAIITCGRGPRAFVGLEHGFTGDLRVRLKDVHARLHMLICVPAMRIF